MKRFLIPRVAHCSSGCRIGGGRQCLRLSPFFFHKTDPNKASANFMKKVDKNIIRCKLMKVSRFPLNAEFLVLFIFLGFLGKGKPK